MRWILITLFFSLNAFAQQSITCSGVNCTYPSALDLTSLNLAGFSTFSINGITDDLEIITPPLEAPRNFRGNVLSNSLAGVNVSVNVPSTKENSPAASFVLIGDSIKNMTVNSSGFNGSNYPNASKVCATNILNGDYGSTIRSKFLQRRLDSPSLPQLCDTTDLAMIQADGEVECSGGQVLSGPNVTATRWTSKRECSTNAGRPLCVARRVAVRCDLYADKAGGNCCNVSPAPDSDPAWTCNVLRCNSSDSGWYKRYTFRMWEYEYSAQLIGGISNEALCNNLVGASSGGNQDTYTLIDRYYETTVDYYSSPSDFVVNPPVGETVIGTQYAAGECGSYSENPYKEFNSFSSWFNSGSDYVRMSGNGHKVLCNGVSSDYPVGSSCYLALYARENPLTCTGAFEDYPIGNQCWEELKPNCTGIYTSYPVGSYCYNKLINNCSGVYTNYPAGSYCYKKLKEQTCSGPYTDFPVGSTCWINNQPTCTGDPTTYPQGSYCYHKQSPVCEDGFIPDDPPSATDMFCTAYLSAYPENTNCTGNYTDYPAGSKCWESLQPNCTGSYLSYAVNSYCYNKLAPSCPGVYSDYAQGSYCYNKLIPETCTGSYTDYPLGSFCSEFLLPTCTGNQTDYPESTYCYYKLAPSCPGVYTDYPIGSYCRKQLSVANSNGEFTCDGVYTNYPTGSYCWQDLQPECDPDTQYTDYLIGSYCYNNLYPGQDTNMDSAFNCSINSGEGSLCWRESFGECDIDDGVVHPVGSYCWRKIRAQRDGYCEGGYSDYPRGSDCWLNSREYPEASYYDKNSCGVKCQFNGVFVSCDIGTPDSDIIFSETTGTYVGQRVHADAFVSFKVRIRTINGLGQEKNNDTEIRLKINDITR